MGLNININETIDVNGTEVKTYSSSNVSGNSLDFICTWDGVWTSVLGNPANISDTHSTKCECKLNARVIAIDMKGIFLAFWPEKFHSPQGLGTVEESFGTNIV